MGTHDAQLRVCRESDLHVAFSSPSMRSVPAVEEQLQRCPSEAVRGPLSEYGHCEGGLGESRGFSWRQALSWRSHLAAGVSGG